MRIAARNEKASEYRPQSGLRPTGSAQLEVGCTNAVRETALSLYLRFSAFRVYCLSGLKADFAVRAVTERFV